MPLKMYKYNYWEKVFAYGTVLATTMANIDENHK